MDTLTQLLLLTTLGCMEIGPVAVGSTAARRREAAYSGEPLVFAAVPLHAPLPVLRVLSATPLRPRRHPPPIHAAATAADVQYDDEPRYTRPSKQRSRPSYQDTDYEETYQFPRASVPPGGAPAGHRSRPRPQVTQYEEEYDTYAPQPATAFATSTSYVQPPQTYSMSYPQQQQSYSSSYVEPQGYSTLAQPQYEAVYATGGSEPAPALLYARPSPSGGYTYRKVAQKTTTPIPIKPTKESPYIIKIHKYRIVKS